MHMKNTKKAALERANTLNWKRVDVHFEEICNGVIIFWVKDKRSGELVEGIRIADSFELYLNRYQAIQTVLGCYRKISHLEMYQLVKEYHNL